MISGNRSAQLGIDDEPANEGVNFDSAADASVDANRGKTGDAAERERREEAAVKLAFEATSAPVSSRSTTNAEEDPFRSDAGRLQSNTPAGSGAEIESEKNINGGEAVEEGSEEGSTAKSEIGIA